MSTRTCCLLFGCVAAASACHAETTLDGPPLLESMDKFATEAEYLKAAEDFLEQPAADPWKPRVANDLIIAATLSGNDARKRRMQAFLLTDHPNSPFGRFLIKSLGAEDFRSIIGALVEQRRRWPHEAFVSRLKGVFDRGLETFGQQSLDESTAEIGALTGTMTGDKELREACLEWFENNNKPPGDVVTLADDPNRSTVDKIQAAAKQAQKQTARLLLEHLLASCAQSERESPSVARAELTCLAYERRLKDAQPLFDRLPGWSDDPQLIFLHGLMNLSAGDDEDAIADFRQLEQLRSGSPWEEIAGDYAESVRALDEHVNTLIDVFLQLVDTLSKDDACFEINMQFTPSLKGYLAFDRASLVTDAAVWENGELILALRREGRLLSAFCSTEGRVIWRWILPGDLGPTLEMAPAITVTEDDEGTIRLQLGLQTGGGARESANASAAKRDFKRFIEPAFLRRFLLQSLRKDAYVLVEPAEGADRSIRMGKCSLSEPVVSEHRLQISADGCVTKITAGNLVADRVRYGKQGDFEFEPPEWPQLPTRVHTSSPQAFLWMAIMKMLASRQAQIQLAI